VKNAELVATAIIISTGLKLPGAEKKAITKEDSSESSVRDTSLATMYSHTFSGVTKILENMFWSFSSSTIPPIKKKPSTVGSVKIINMEIYSLVSTGITLISRIYRRLTSA
jgi:hypothetical protein